MAYLLFIFFLSVPSLVYSNWHHGQGNGYCVFNDDPLNTIDVYGLQSSDGALVETENQNLDALENPSEHVDITLSSLELGMSLAASLRGKQGDIYPRLIDQIMNKPYSELSPQERELRQEFIKEIYDKVIVLVQAGDQSMLSVTRERRFRLELEILHAFIDMGNYCCLTYEHGCGVSFTSTSYRGLFRDSLDRDYWHLGYDDLENLDSLNQNFILMQSSGHVPIVMTKKKLMHGEDSVIGIGYENLGMILSFDSLKSNMSLALHEFGHFIGIDDHYGNGLMDHEHNSTVIPDEIYCQQFEVWIKSRKREK